MAVRVDNEPVFLCADARAGYFKETVGTVIAADFDRNTAIAADGVALFAEKEFMEKVETVGRRWCSWRRGDRVCRKTCTVIKYSWGHCARCECVFGVIVTRTWSM
jgi:hypothetical protein